MGAILQTQFGDVPVAVDSTPQQKEGRKKERNNNSKKKDANVKRTLNLLHNFVLVVVVAVATSISPLVCTHRTTVAQSTRCER